MSTRAFARELDRVVEGRPRGHFRASPDQGAALAAAIALHLSATLQRVPDRAFVQSLAGRLRRAESQGASSRPLSAKTPSATIT
jgi:hypothetical protein